MTSRDICRDKPTFSQGTEACSCFPQLCRSPPGSLVVQRVSGSHGPPRVLSSEDSCSLWEPLVPGPVCRCSRVGPVAQKGLSGAPGNSRNMPPLNIALSSSSNLLLFLRAQSVCLWTWVGCSPFPLGAALPLQGRRPGLSATLPRAPAARRAQPRPLRPLFRGCSGSSHACCFEAVGSEL